MRLRQVDIKSGETLAEETVMFTPENKPYDDDNDDNEDDEDDVDIDDVAAGNVIPMRREKVMLRNLKPSSKYEVRH